MQRWPFIARLGHYAHAELARKSLLQEAMDGGTYNVMKAERTRSLSLIGVRDVRSKEERTKERVIDEAAEKALREPPVLKLRGREVTLADYIREGRVRSPHKQSVTQHSHVTTSTLSPILPW